MSKPLRWTTGLGLFLVVMVAACAQNSTPSTVISGSPAAEEDIAEAVFRYQFEHNASAIQGAAEKYCLSLPGEQSPRPELLGRFAGHHPTVVAAAQCEKRSGKSLFFRILRLDWRKDHEVWVRGGYWEGNLSSSVELFRVVNENGKWKVTGARVEAIS